MDLTLDGNNVIKWFKEISKIPRCSGDEVKISTFLLEFSEKYGLEAFIEDISGNVIIKKKASIGYENSPCVILQGHLDMVCEKNQGVNHNFSIDPIKLIEENGIFKAQGTTLGADNGIAIAYALTLLSSNKYQHPALEVILTTEEETSMKGAEFFNPDSLDGSILINLDAEEEGVFYVSSSGGIDHHIYMNTLLTKPSLENKLSISISGLRGGHSGADIHKERGNSIKILARILNSLSKEFEFELSNFNGGSKINAIPRESNASLFINKGDLEKITSFLKNMENDLNNEMGIADSFNIKINEIHDYNSILDSTTTKKLLNTLLIIESGIDHSSIEIDDFVISSQNLGVVSMDQKIITISTSIRSSIKSLKDSMVDKLNIIANILELDYKTEADYPEWQYNPESKIRDLASEVYQNLFKTKPIIKAIHAGLECGFFADSLKNQNIDIISFGPNMNAVHSPDEELDILSTDRTFIFLVELLKSIK